PESISRLAYSISSSTNKSIDPTPMNAGGRPARFSTLAGTAPAGTTREPAGTPSKELQTNRFDAGTQRYAPIYGGTWRELPVRSSSIGYINNWKAIGTSPRSRAAIASMAAWPPPALSPITAIRDGSTASELADPWSHFRAA